MQYGCLKLVHFSKKSGRLSSTGSEILTLGSHCWANFQPILDCFITKFKLEYDDLENIRFFVGHPVYRKCRNRVVAENRKSKASYFKNYFATYSGNMKMLWSGIKSIINAKKKSANLISSLTDKDGNSVNDSSKMAEMFNDFFTNISAKINDSIPHTKKSSLDYLTNRNDKSFFISPKTSEEVEAIIISLNSGTSSGHTS